MLQGSENKAQILAKAFLNFVIAIYLLFFWSFIVNFENTYMENYPPWKASSKIS